eukprot:1157764-Pelagomonas_calceolata.AAC.10
MKQALDRLIIEQQVCFWLLTSLVSQASTGQRNPSNNVWTTRLALSPLLNLTNWKRMVFVSKAKEGNGMAALPCFVINNLRYTF